MGSIAAVILGHGGVYGAIAETSLVLIVLGVFGFFLRRSAKKEHEQHEKSRAGPPKA